MTGYLYAQRSTQEVKSVRGIMKKYALVYEFAEDYAKAAENMFQDANLLRGFFSKSASVVMDHPYWYYEPKGASTDVSIDEYCQYFTIHQNKDNLLISAITICNLEVKQCVLEDDVAFFKVSIDKIIDFRDELFQYYRTDTCREVLYIRDTDGRLSIERITMQSSPFHSVQREMKEAVARVTPAEIPLKKAPELQRQINILMKMMRDGADEQKQPRKRKSKG